MIKNKNGRLAKNTQGVTGERSIECEQDESDASAWFALMSIEKCPKEYAAARIWKKLIRWDFDYVTYINEIVHLILSMIR